MKALENEWHRLTNKEIAYNEICIAQMENVGWAKRIVRSIKQNGGIMDRRTQGFLFELRVAHQLHSKGAVTIHEYATGLGSTTVDFYLPEHNALIEVVSVDETEEVKSLTYKEALVDEHEQLIGQEGKFLMLRTDDEGREMIKLQQKIGEKVFKNGKKVKFPVLTENALHIILVDERGACGGSGLCLDQRRQLAYGPDYDELDIRFSLDDKLIRGLFDPANQSSYAAAVSERVDVVAIVREKEFQLGELAERTSFYCKPGRHKNYIELFKGFPLMQERQLSEDVDD